MTDIVELAKQCGAGYSIDAEDGVRFTDFSPAALAAFADRIRREEREACAMVCESHMEVLDAALRMLGATEYGAKCGVIGRKDEAIYCATVIRSRGK